MLPLAMKIMMDRILFLCLLKVFITNVNGRQGRLPNLSQGNHLEIPNEVIFNTDFSLYNNISHVKVTSTSSERIRTVDLQTNNVPPTNAWSSFQNGQQGGLSSIPGPLSSLLAWKPYCTGGSIYSSVAIDAYQNSYFASYDGFFYSLDMNGKRRWSFSMSTKGSSTPALKADGTVVYVFGEDGTGYALSTADGSLIWPRTLCAPVYSSPLVGPDGTSSFYV